MRVLIATDSRCYINDGKILVSEKLAKIIPRYFRAFGKIVFLARLDRESPNANLTDITEMIEELLTFDSFWKLYTQSFYKKAKDLAKKCDLIIGRFEAFSAIQAYRISQKERILFFGEVMSDPWDGLWNHGILGKIVAPYSYYMTKKAMSKADFGLYVTKTYLQERFPCPHPTVAASNVYLNSVDDDILQIRRKRIEQMDYSCISLMTTAATYVRYKGQEYVIKAIPILNRAGIKVKYYLVGEGSQEYLRRIAKKHKVEDQVVFLGRLPLEDVFNQIDNTDIYIQPSLQEGLPRAVIEAMSRACPCLGAKTAGIPELIHAEAVFEKKSEKAIAEKILMLIDEKKLETFAEENFENSKLYLDSILDKRRNEYYDYVKECIIQRKIQ